MTINIKSRKAEVQRDVVQFNNTQKIIPWITIIQSKNEIKNTKAILNTLTIKCLVINQEKIEDYNIQSEYQIKCKYLEKKKGYKRRKQSASAAFNKNKNVCIKISLIQ